MKGLALFFCVVLVSLCGCQNNCKELAEKVCDRAGSNVAACEGTEGDLKAKKDCARLKSVAASCKVLERVAEEATDDEQTACKADLALLRALEKQKM